MTSTVIGLPSRTMSSVVFSPGAIAFTRTDNDSESTIGDPLNLRITSPGLMPARAAALSGTTCATRAPSGAFSLKD